MSAFGQKRTLELFGIRVKIFMLLYGYDAKEVILIKFFKLSLSKLLLIKLYGFPLQSWVTTDFLSSVYQDRLVRIVNANGDEGFHLRTRLDSIFNIFAVSNIFTVLSNEKSIRVEAGPVMRAISKIFSVFFLVYLVIGLIVVLEVFSEDKSVLGRGFILIIFCFAFLTSLANFAHFLQYIFLRSRLSRAKKRPNSSDQ